MTAAHLANSKRIGHEWPELVTKNRILNTASGVALAPNVQGHVYQT